MIDTPLYEFHHALDGEYMDRIYKHCEYYHYYPSVIIDLVVPSHYRNCLLHIHTEANGRYMNEFLQSFLKLPECYCQVNQFGFSRCSFLKVRSTDQTKNFFSCCLLHIITHCWSYPAIKLSTFPLWQSSYFTNYKLVSWEQQQCENVPSVVVIIFPFRMLWSLIFFNVFFFLMKLKSVTSMFIWT